MANEKALTTVTSLEKSITSLGGPLAEFLLEIGLPTEEILSPIVERKKIINALKDAINLIPEDEKSKSIYLSKFTVAVSVGLFDGALNYLWDETIKALRRLVISFDLEYFFNIAESLSSRYKNLTTEEDLSEVSEHDLLEICRRIGLINTVNYKRLEHVNYMRNHASSAHPNEIEITGYEMVSFLEHCLKYAITANPDHSSVSLKQLLNNIRQHKIPLTDFEPIGNDIARQPQVRIDDFLSSLFGMYCDPNQGITVKSNIEQLSKYVWDAATEDKKLGIGTKYGFYRNNGDIPRKDSANKFLETVDGLRYKDEDSLAAELIQKLQNLRSVHYEWNNFYNEYLPAQSLKSSIPHDGSIPEAARIMFVKIVCVCFIGNGLGYKEGVCESALHIYQNYINNFEEEEIIAFLNLLSDSEFTKDFYLNKPDQRVRNLASLFKKKSKNVYIKNALDNIINGPANKIDSVYKISAYEKTMGFVNKLS